MASGQIVLCENIVEVGNMRLGMQMICPKCGSDRVAVQAVSDVKTEHRGCLGWLFWIILAICTFGLILIIPALTNSKTSSNSHTEAVCQHCGHRWKVKKEWW